MSRPAPAAFLALWNSISSAAVQPEYEAWHTFEHVPERVGLPGFAEARRYRSRPASPDVAPDYFTCYWLDGIAALNTPQYSGIFGAPTAWTARMRGELRAFFRLPCTVSGAFGQSSASQLATLHFRAEPEVFAPAVNTALAPLVHDAALVSAQWGRFAQTEAIPIANRAAAQDAPVAGTDFVLMLHSLDAHALPGVAQALTKTLSSVATAMSPPAYFELLSQVRQDDLAGPLGARQPARPDLLQRFQKGDTPS